MLASLNHPHIGMLHGLEESDGHLALVLELVEGETLAERLARGPVPLQAGAELGAADRRGARCGARERASSTAI